MVEKPAGAEEPDDIAAIQCFCQFGFRKKSKEVCIAALVEHQFPLASRYGKELHMLGGKLKADCVALLLQMFDIPFCVSPFVVYIFVCVAWCDPGTSIGVGEASCFCSSTRSGVVERDT